MPTNTAPMCDYCRRFAGAYLSSSYRLGTPHGNKTDSKHACHQHIGRALEELAWNDTLNRTVGVFIVPVGPIAARMREARTEGVGAAGVS